ncbi:hypothetical protein [Zoogloea sp.]|uniref:hypothetical protein n=1 Tax=Zoogloea sp. TaxID=49181 RepID=UPI002605E316|nr:hypothetical protein [Zoogloea sp.]MDD3354867.1 hypothetical protein [Zoogloea sp.]
MHLPYRIAILAVVALALAAGCQKQDQPSLPAQLDPVARLASEPSTEPAPHPWTGTWDGPEGTYLKLVARPDSKFDVIIHDLDKERTFEGTANSDYISFDREGIQERIVATNGEATGMKWLAEKSTCLTVKEGEGYCRD